MINDSNDHLSKQQKIRKESMDIWRRWAFYKEISDEEKRLRKIIGGAYLRLDRLDSCDPEVTHAKEILIGAMNGGQGSFP